MDDKRRRRRATGQGYNFNPERKRRMAANAKKYADIWLKQKDARDADTTDQE